MFHGKHQPGITTPFRPAATWSPSTWRRAPAARRRPRCCAAGRPAQRLMAGEAAAHDDTDVALDAGPSSLTVTFGFGHGFFARTGLENAAPGRARPAARLLLRPPRQGPQQRRPVGADRRRRRAGRLPRAARAPEGGGHAARVRWQMNGFNRIAGRHRPPDDHPQPDGPGRRHQQPEAVRDRLRPADLRARRPANRLDGRRLVRRRPADPDAPRRLGGAVGQAAGAGHRAAQGGRRPAQRRLRDHRDGPGEGRRGRRAGRSPSTPTPGSPAPRRTAAPRCCAARSRTTTASGRTAPRTPGCSSSAGRPTRCAASSRSSASSTGATRSPVHPARGERPVRGARRARAGRVRGAAAAGGVTRRRPGRCPGAGSTPWAAGARCARPPSAGPLG